jgi:Rap1a immunity proteins
MLPGSAKSSFGKAIVMSNSRLAFLAVIVLFSGTIASAQSSDPAARPSLSFSGNEFLEFCSLEVNRGECLMYMSGVVHGLLDASFHHGSPISLCIPEGVTNQQIFDVAFKYLRDHPESRNYRSGMLVSEAIIETWPCKKSSDHASRPGAAASHGNTATTFRGHTLGESWQSFIRTEAGLCKLKDNAEECSKAESGASALLLQQKIENGQVVDGVVFVFQHGHLDNVSGSMNGPTFADLSFLEKTYGPPFSKESNAKRGFALSTWTFSDGGEVRAEECSNGTGGFTININVMPTPPPYLGKLHLASLDQTDAGLNSGTDGLYQSGLINGCCWEYLRFYADGTVIEVSSTGAPLQISRWFRKPYNQSGKYEVQGSTIRFSITSPENPDYTIDFRGQVQGDMLTLEWLSYQNGRQEHEIFHLVASCT